MFDAKDRNDVLSWTQRQLGDAATRAAVVELAEPQMSDWVEKSGTGLQQTGCQALLSVMADSVQLVGGSAAVEISDYVRSSGINIRVRKSTIH